MLGIYILSAMLGGGLLLFSILSGAHHDASDVDMTGLDADVAGVDVDVAGADVSDVDLHVTGADVDAHIDHDADWAHDAAGELILGLFKPRNMIFFLAGFGLTGTLLTLLGSPQGSVFGLAIGMGAGAMLVTHALFLWLRRSESGIDTISEREIEGRAARVVLPLQPGRPGQVSCLVGGQECYLTARLAADESGSVAAGSEVVILRVENGIAEVIPFDTRELPSAES
jgi:hypothetical protein